MNIFEKIISSEIEDKCSICLEKKVNNMVIYQCRQCKHQFHKNCLDKWLLRKYECPDCRFNNKTLDPDLDLYMIDALLIYNEFEWHNIQYHYQLSQHITMVISAIKQILFFIFIVFSMFLIICFY